MLNQPVAASHYCVTALTLQPSASLRVSVSTYMEALRQVRLLLREALPIGGVVEVYPPDDPEPEGWNVSGADGLPIAHIDLAKCAGWWCAPDTGEGVPALTT